MRRFRLIDILTLGVLITAIGITLEDRLSISTRLRAYFDARAQRQTIALEWPHIDSIVSPTWSPADTGPLVVEALQYSCGGCIEAAPSIRTATTGTARLALLHIPKDNDSVAMHGAALSICASAVGAGREMHVYLVSTDAWHSRLSNAALVHATGDSLAASISQCVESEQWRPVVAAHRALASRLRISYTPYFFGRTGATIPSPEGLAELIVRERGANADADGLKTGGI